MAGHINLVSDGALIGGEIAINNGGSITIDPEIFLVSSCSWVLCNKLGLKNVVNVLQIFAKSALV